MKRIFEEQFLGGDSCEDYGDETYANINPNQLWKFIKDNFVSKKFLKSAMEVARHPAHPKEQLIKHIKDMI